MPIYKPVYEGTPPLFTSLFVESPRNQSFFSMFHYTLFPYFEPASISFAWSLGNIFLFIGCFWVDHIAKSGELMQTSQKALFTLGQMSPVHLLVQRQYFRLLLSLMLFRNFTHLLFSVICIVILCSYIEKYMESQFSLIGWKKTFLMVFLSGIAGQLFGLIINKKVCIEGYTPICGMIGYLLGYAFVCWSRWYRYSSQRFHMVLGLLIMGLAFFYWSYTYGNLNFASMAAATIFGFIYSFAQNNEKDSGRSSRIVRIIAGILIVSSLIFLSLYTILKLRPMFL